MTDAGQVTPLTQTQLFGHGDLLATWQQAFTTQKLHHGLLLSGHDGAGKATLAYQFLKWLFKQQSTQPHLIEKQMLAGSYPGLKIVERLFDEKRQKYAGEITLDAVAPIFDFLRLSVINGGYRAILIDGVDRMNRSAQNTILKLLEEPPARTLFILLAEQPGLVLATIRSRCMRYALKPLSMAEFSNGLTALAPDVPPRDHAALYELSDGALGQAIHWQRQDWSSLYDETVTAAVALGAGQTRPALKWAEKYAPAAQDTDFDVVRDLLLKRFARIVTALRQNAALQPLIMEEADLLIHWRQQKPDDLLKAYDRLDQILRTGERSHLDRKLVLLQALQVFACMPNAVAQHSAYR